MIQNILNIRFVLITALFLTACTDKKTSTANNIPQKINFVEQNIATAQIEIEGMQCMAGCARSIEKELNKLEGVKTAEVDFDLKKATVEFDSTYHSINTLIQTIENTNDGNTFKAKSL
ncbi:MAG: heavy metal-associated domain-containing protein [Bacteroidota bacterium]|nr:heavy metal-associated domain-containing protein [Bacteroidota bacterium]